MRLLRLLTCTLAGGLLLGASSQGCVSPVVIDEAVLSYDKALSRVRSELLLLNVARARAGLPLNGSEVSGVTASFEFEASADVTGALSPLGAAEGAAGALELGVTTRAAEAPTLSIVPLQGEAFTRRLLEPIPDRTFEFLHHRGVGLGLLLRLLGQALILEGPPDAALAPVGAAGAPLRGDAAGAAGAPPRGDAAGAAGAPPRGDAAGAAGAPPRGDAGGAAGAPPRRDAAGAAGAPPRGDAGGTAGAPPRGDAGGAAGAPPRGDAGGAAGAPPRGDAAGAAGAPPRGDAGGTAGAPPGDAAGAARGETARRAVVANDPARREEFAAFRRHALELDALAQDGRLELGPIARREEWRPPADAGLEDITHMLDHGFELVRDETGPLLFRRVEGRILLSSYDPDLRSEAERLALAERARLFPPGFVLLDVEGSDALPPLRGWLKLRSLQQVLEFVARGIDPDFEALVPASPSSSVIDFAPQPVRTLIVLETPGRPDDAAVAVELHGRWYSLPALPPGKPAMDDWNHRAFAVLMDLWQLTTRTPGAPLPTVVSVGAGGE